MTTKPELTPELKQEIIAWLMDSIQLDVETKSDYTGGMDGGYLYRNSHTLKLSLEGQLITEVYLD